MSLLVLALPPGPPGPSGSYAFATSHDGQALAAHGSAAAELLPPAGRGVEVVAVVPAAQLSWHRVDLPRGVGPRSPRLRATLVGLLEDRLLDEPEQLHFALDPDASGGGPAWVAVCRRDWLAAHLRALDAARRPAGRIVPELSPQAGALRLLVTGEPERAQVLMSGTAVPGGAQALPLGPGTLALLRAATAHDGEAPEAELLAEPAVAALAEQTLDRPVTLVPPAARLLAASRSPWNLAQFELARTGTAWAGRRAGAAWREFLHAPRWRPARWGVALLLLAHLVGLNLWAWRTRDELAARRAQVQAALTQTFPQVKVVVDAPVQMAREVAALRRSTGAASGRDLEPMLSAFAQSAGDQPAPTAIEFTAGELRLKGVQLLATGLTDMQTQLRPLGYRLQAEADGAVLREGVAP